jgi:hypothetical protein
VHHLAGFASLSGTPEDYFVGWLTFHGEQVPVFDLSRVVSDEPTPECIGSRILIVAAQPGGQPGDRPGASTRFLGLLASGMTDTLSPEQAAEATPLDLDSYLPMLYTLIPPIPAGV